MSNLAEHYPSSMQSFISYLDSLSERPDLDVVVRKMREFEITMEQLNGFAKFNQKHYARNVVFENEHVQLLCLCWHSGQRSPIHDHAQSICAVKVVTGTASETVYELTPSGYIKPISTVDYGVGVIGSADNDTHQVANLQELGNDLVTLHCYIPPLTKMKTYSIDSTRAEVYEPVNEGHIFGCGI